MTAVIVIACLAAGVLTLAATWLVLRRDDQGAHAAPRRARDWLAAEWDGLADWALDAPELHHDEYAPTNLVPGAGVLPDTPSPVTTATCPAVHEIPAKVDSPAPEHVPGRDGARGPVASQQGIAVDPAPETGTAQGQPEMTPVAAFPAEDQAPGPDGLPEGDTAGPWPPQETTGPEGLPPMSPELTRWLAEAEEAERAAQAAADWEQLAGTTRRPFTDYLRDSIAMPAIRGM